MPRVVKALLLLAFLVSWELAGLVSWEVFGVVRAEQIQPDKVVVDRGVPVKMRDGVVLFADVYRPAGPGRFPVLLERTPYDKAVDKEIDIGTRAAAEGYVVIVQDVRGRYTSGGEWYPFRHESQDGYDTVEWAAALPYSNGKVGMFGSSYVGATQMLAAIAHPPHLAGICPMFTPSNYHSEWIYLGGAFSAMVRSNLDVDSGPGHCGKISEKHYQRDGRYARTSFDELPGL